MPEKASPPPPPQSTQTTAFKGDWCPRCGLIISVLTLLFFVSGTIGCSQTSSEKSLNTVFTGPVKPISSGLGSWGPHGTKRVSLPNPCWSMGDIHLFLPSGHTGALRVPVIFFSHGYGSSNPATYNKLIRFMVSHGAAVIFSTYRKITHLPGKPNNYELLYCGFREAVRVFGSSLDTTRVGFVGHSFGGGATPWITLTAINDLGWGKEAAFMYIMAPWYFYGITDSQLATFPSHVQLIMQVYSDDQVNDPAIAAELFNTIGLERDAKLFVKLHSDTAHLEDGGHYIYRADHHVPKSAIDPKAVYDAYLYHAVFRLCHALFNRAFIDGAGEALNPIPGEGLANRGSWPCAGGVGKMEFIENPHFDQNALGYFFPFRSILNPRRSTVVTPSK